MKAQKLHAVDASQSNGTDNERAILLRLAALADSLVLTRSWELELFEKRCAAVRAEYATLITSLVTSLAVTPALGRALPDHFRLIDVATLETAYHGVVALLNDTALALEDGRHGEILEAIGAVARRLISIAPKREARRQKRILDLASKDPRIAFRLVTFELDSTAAQTATDCFVFHAESALDFQPDQPNEVTSVIDVLQAVLRDHGAGEVERCGRIMHEYLCGTELARAVVESQRAAKPDESYQCQPGGLQAGTEVAL